MRTVLVTGPTATGKTALGVRLCRQFGGEIVSADSRQVYSGLDLGTGKDLEEYLQGGSPVRHHLIDIVPPDAEYHLFKFVADAQAALAEIRSRQLLPVVVGGTPLYLNALLEGYRLEGGGVDLALRASLEAEETPVLLERLRRESPAYYARTDLANRRRIIRALEIVKTSGPEPAPAQPPLDALILAPYFERSVVHRRIEQRLDARLGQGLIAEVAALHAAGLSWERLDWFGLEYRFVARHLKGELSYAEMRMQLLQGIRQFCKRQDIWFRKMEREGKTIHWLPGGDAELAGTLVAAYLAGDPLPPPALQLKDIRYG